MILKVCQSLQLLLHQGLAIRGKIDDTSNLIQLLKYRALEDPKIIDGLNKSYNKYQSINLLNASAILTVPKNEMPDGICTHFFDLLMEVS